MNQELEDDKLQLVQQCEDLKRELEIMYEDIARLSKEDNKISKELANLEKKTGEEGKVGVVVQEVGYGKRKNGPIVDWFPNGDAEIPIIKHSYFDVCIEKFFENTIDRHYRAKRDSGAH
ncbi:hypothetical protein KGF56_002996 [Candida oxycetoniae]|uniref:Uncharacterized protein n=1 Tax=Candida oxycetoniae TaxID=497107 RepID=A0AAI9SX87_9ASCO|nr:uncharacterized protein KGF56_002996 [Candida oxycetoniae]KAI3404235.1 hypothetical protein KGF56_002996 [Candida oxycetoniae]